jgi:hypothetical protein
MSDTNKPSPGTVNLSMDGLPAASMQITPDPLLKATVSARMQTIPSPTVTTTPAPAPEPTHAATPTASPTSSENNNG